MQMKFASRSSPRLLLCMPLQAMISMFILLPTSTTKGLLQEKYVGCFYDEIQATVALKQNDALTIETCIKECQSNHTTYAALQKGNICHCRDDHGVQLGLPDSACYLPCSGNNSEICGGYIGQSVTYSLYAVCPVGTYGAACDKGCHCKRDIPCNRTQGKCPDGCYGNWDGSACNIMAISHQHLGCYKDSLSNRALPRCIYCDENAKENKNNTIPFCLASCAANNFSYAGLQYSYQCFCGDSYNKHGTATNCNSNCSGDSSTTCGGADANSVYSVCPSGNYGNSCTGRCHCLNDEGCIYRIGSCSSSLCKEGWTGSTCNIRDCAKNKGDCNVNETCSSINLKYSTVNVCRCQNGFQRTKIWDDCTDTDECSLMVCDPESTTCNNTIGSYNCTCKIGFEANNFTTCIDIDECQQNICDNSTTDCHNTPGSFSCICKQGFEMFNSRNCSENIPGLPGGNTGAAVGSVLLVVAVVAIALVMLLLYRRRNDLCKSNPDEIKSQPTVRYSTYTQSSSQEKFALGDQQESEYANGSIVIVNDLPQIIQQKLSGHGVLEKEFKLVPMETKDPSTVGKKRELKKKNRFQNIVPYDKNRVVLSEVRGVAYSDYINASLIKGYRYTDKLIATQGPLPDTINDFWRMVCEKDVGVIVMITDLKENNKNKCAKYWPERQEPLNCKDITVRTTSEQQWNGYASRSFQVTKDVKSWEVTHWHFLSYPDHGVPDDVAKFMAFLKKARSSMSPGKSTVVHCSAGAGRTGTFIAIDYLMQQGNAGGDVDIFGCLQYLRKQRPQMIQNLAQYEFVHTALLFEYTVGDTTIPCSSFAAKFGKLQMRDPNTGTSKLEAQLQCLEGQLDHGAKDGKRRASSKYVHEQNATFLQGWKQNDAYITLAVPSSTYLDDFYSRIKEFKCGVIILLDENLGTVESLFPTKQKPIVLPSSTVHCENSSKEVYGTCYKISEINVSDDTYANVGVYANAGEVSKRSEMTVLHVTNQQKTDSLECSVLNSIYNCIKKQNVGITNRPVVVLSRAGDAVSAFCLAALIAFEMIRDVREVDIFQIVQGMQKSQPQFTFSLPSFDELYSVVGKYIESGVAAESISQEPIYEVTR